MNKIKKLLNMKGRNVLITGAAGYLGQKMVLNLLELGAKIYLTDISAEKLSSFKKKRSSNLSIIPCDLCGSQDGLERKKIKEMLKQWEFDFPGRKQVMYKALSNSNPSHLLDRSLFNFSNLYRNRL